MQTQAEFLATVQQRLAPDARISAAWLTGSLGRGLGDRWSDIDLHIIPEPADTSFRAEVDAHLALAAIISEHGRTLADCPHFVYPEALEAAVLNYVLGELALIGLAAPVQP